MDISSVSNTSFSRSVKPAESSRDRQSNNQSQAMIAENKPQERTLQQRAVEEKHQQHKENEQRRLDGRLISFGQEQDNVSSHEKKASYNRSRVNDAYNSSRNTLRDFHRAQAQRSHQRESEIIDIVV